MNSVNGTPESKISELIRTSLEKIREVVDVNTVVGEPVWNQGGITVIPVSKVSVGTASGGLDGFGKNLPANQKNGSERQTAFGGGGGIGVTVNPLGFLVIKETGLVEFISIASASSASTAVTIVDTVSDFLDRSPELIEKLKNIFKPEGSSRKKDSKEGSADPEKPED